MSGASAALLLPCALVELSHFAVLPLVVLAAACARPEPYVDPVERRAGYRAALYSHMQPVKLSNCEFERVGDKHDGGYVICKNLSGAPNRFIRTAFPPPTTGAARCRPG